MIVLANFGVLIRMTIAKIQQNKAKKLYEKRQRIIKKLESRIKKKTKEQLPISHPMRPLTLIEEEADDIILESFDESE